MCMLGVSPCIPVTLLLLIISLLALPLASWVVDLLYDAGGHFPIPNTRDGNPTLTPILYLKHLMILVLQGRMYEDIRKCSYLYMHT